MNDTKIIVALFGTTVRVDPRWVNAEDAAIGAWIRLVAYCAGQRNGGVIQVLANNNRGWLALCGSTYASIRAAVEAGLVGMSDDMKTFTVQGFDEMTRLSAQASEEAQVEQRRSKWREQWHARERLRKDSAETPGTSVEAPKSAHSYSEYSEKQSKSKSNASAETPKRRKRVREVPDPGPDFPAFWKAYPRKVAKEDAIIAWAGCRPPLAECLKTLAWQIEAEGWGDKKNRPYVPYPASWINGKRWTDEAPAGPVVPESFRELIPPPKPINRAALLAPAPVKNGQGH